MQEAAGADEKAEEKAPDPDQKALEDKGVVGPHASVKLWCDSWGVASLSHKMYCQWKYFSLALEARPENMKLIS